MTFIIENKNTFFVVIMYFMWLLKIYWNCDICNTCTSRRILNNVGYYMKLKYEEKISWIIYWTHKTFCGKHCLWKESLYSVALMVNNFTDINKMNDHLCLQIIETRVTYTRRSPTLQRKKKNMTCDVANFMQFSLSWTNFF